MYVINGRPLPVVGRQNPEIFTELEALYGDDAINNLDIWPTGMLETTAQGPGELFTAIILNQFGRIRDGDRFWFENYKMNGYENAAVNVSELFIVYTKIQLFLGTVFHEIFICKCISYISMSDIVCLAYTITIDKRMV